jgi:hypothetical protein
MKTEYDALLTDFFAKAKDTICTCKNVGSFADIYAERTVLSPNTNNDRRKCTYHRLKSAMRFVRQNEQQQAIGDEVKLTIYENAASWERTSARWRKRKQRGGEQVGHRPFHLQDGTIAVFHNCEDEPGEVQPQDSQIMYATMLDVLSREGYQNAKTGKDIRTRAAGSWGGCYRGTRGNSAKKKDDRYALKTGVSARKLRDEAYSNYQRTDSFGRTNIEVDCVTSFQNLKDYERALWERGENLELVERWPQGMDNKVVNTIYNHPGVIEVIKFNKAVMSRLMHSSKTLLCNKRDIHIDEPLEQQLKQQSLLDWMHEKEYEAVFGSIDDDPTDDGHRKYQPWIENTPLEAMLV